MTEEQAKRKLAAIFSADVKGYSRLMQDDEEATVRTITAYREVMVARISGQNGRVVDAKGDNILAEFPSVVNAVRCAVEIQRELKKRNAELPEHRKMQFRIGINLGDVIEEEDTIYGDGVNIAARLEGLADGGGICISGTAFEHTGKRLRLGYEYLGEQEVKNIEKPVRVYRVLMEPEAAGRVIGEERPKPKKWWWAGAAIFLIMAAGALAIWNFHFRAPPIEPASVEKMAFPLPEKPSIAVLPFDNMSGDPKQEYFSDGMTEEIITALAKVPYLFVIARNSTFSYKGKPVKIRQVAEELGVRYVLEGSVRRSEDRVRVTAQLIDAINGHHVWAERYDRDLKDVFALQDEITTKILWALEVKLSEGEKATTHRKTTDNLEAYLKILQAMEGRYLLSQEGNLLAQKRAEEAMALDPEYARPYRVLALTNAMDILYGTSKSPQKSMKRALEMAQKAISLDDSDPCGYEVLSFIYLMKRQHDRAIAEAERAITLDPNGADAYYRLGFGLIYSGRPEEAIAPLEKAIRINPIAPSEYFLFLGRAYGDTGRYEEAISEFRKAIHLSPDSPFPHVHLATTYSLAGRVEEARAEVEKVLKINPKASIEDVKRAPYKNQTDRDRMIDALRKAGLPDKPPLPLPDKPSIAVLPFVNMSDDKGQEYFSDGLTEEIITALSKTPKLFVIARNSTFVYKGKPVNVQQVSRELGVMYVLEGSVRRSGDQLRITAQLIDATTGNHLWAERYDRELKDVFAIQDEITLEIIKAMQVELTEGETARVTGRGTKNLDAYLLALHAQEEWLSLDREGSIKARQLASEVISLDPEYGYPYAILAWCRMLDVVRHYSRSPEESMRLAVNEIQKALALDVSDHRIHRILSNLYVIQGKHEEAIAASKRALELCPGGAGAYENLGIALLFACRPIEAIPMLKRAIELDPFPPAVCHRNLAMAYCYVGRYEDAIEQGQKAFQVNPKDLSTPFALVFAYAKLGRKEEARAAAAEVLRIDPEFTLDSMAETRQRMFAAKCHSDRVDEDIEFIRKADVGLK